MKTAACLALAIAALLAASQGATAGSDHGRYRIVPFPAPQDGATGKVVILDQQTGTLWTWSEAGGASYVPGILRPGNPGAFARIIRVGP